MTADRAGGNLRRQGLAFFGAVLALAALAAPALAERRTAHGTRLSLDLPASFRPARTFAGFEDPALGASVVVLEAPGAAYAAMSSGMTPEALAQRGVRDAVAGKLARSDEHVYLTARQGAAEGEFIKFILLVKDALTTALVTVNVPTGKTEGALAPERIAAALAGARLENARAPALELFRFGYLGPFRLAAALMGSARVYTLTGEMPVQRLPVPQPVLIVAPSLSKLPLGDVVAFSERALAQFDGLREARIAEKRTATIGGAAGAILTGEGRDTETGEMLVFYQAIAPSAEGGYFRLIGLAPAVDGARFAAEFARIGESFTEVR